jgi:HSP20 family protein
MQTKSAAIRTRSLDDDSSYPRLLHDLENVVRSLRRPRGDVWHPPTDVYETEQEVVVKLCLPGIRASQVAVEFSGEAVTICGVRRTPDLRSVRAYHQMEIRNGYFERRVVVHRPFDAQAARWRYEDGFLYVMLPKTGQPIVRVMSVRISL